MNLVARSPQEQNEAVLDPWSAVHFAAGLAMGLLGVSLPRGVAVAATYEVVEHAAEQHEAGRKVFLTKGPESPANIAVDLGLFAAGQTLGLRWLAR